MATAGINADAIERWLRAAGIDLQPPVRFELLAGGHSNLTFRLDDASGSRVLRRPPLGQVLESAHDMAREYRIIHAVAQSTVPVPQALALCEDRSVNDAPFYVMAHVDGAVLHDAAAAASLSAEQRRSLSEEVIDVLVNLHRVDPDRIGLGDLGRKEAYIERQLRRWKKQWLAAKTHEIPEMDATLTLLEERLPEQIGASIVHGDYRLGNMIVRDGSIKAVLDWELCTLGDPLADLGYTLNWWAQPEDDNAETAPTGAGGFLTREAMAECYANGSGRDLSQLNYYRAFSHWRLAAIGQGVYKRYLTGAMGEDHGQDLDERKDGVARGARNALELLESLR
ncbi:MAG: phosphotransferase family protein [Pseudomonadota bacterium]